MPAATGSVNRAGFYRTPPGLMIRPPGTVWKAPGLVPDQEGRSYAPSFGKGFLTNPFAHLAAGLPGSAPLSQMDTAHLNQKLFLNPRQIAAGAVHGFTRNS
jgi:hypothetical protein